MVIKKEYFIYVLFLLAGSLQAALPEEAERLYLHGEYAAALSLYQQIESPSRSIYYAMGACSHHCGDDAQALAYWKKAEHGASLGMREAIDKAKGTIYQENGREYHVDWGRKMRRIWSMIPVFFLQLLIISILGLQFLLSSSKRLKILLRIVLIFSFISMYQIIDDNTYGVVRRPVPVYAGPRDNYSTIAQLQSFDEVTIEDKRDTWYKIRHFKIKGWVDGKDIALA